MRGVKEQKKKWKQNNNSKKKGRPRVERYDLKLTSMVNKALVAKRLN